MAHRTCIVCGEPFDAVTNQKMCSVECRRNRRCQVDGCGDPANGRHCKHHAYLNRTYGDPLHQRACSVCGEPCDPTTGSNPTCSDACSAEQARRRVEKYRRRSGKRRTADAVVTCKEPGCHNLVPTTASRYAPKRCDVCNGAGEGQSAASRLRRYGLTSERYRHMLSVQGGRCAVCGSRDPGGRGVWHIDHDHACCERNGSCGECVRGLLCNNCNVAAGLLGDSAGTAKALADYLLRGGMRQPQR